MEVEIISREMIVPSSPTPPHLRTFKMSLLSQLVPPIHTPIIFHYLPSRINCDIPKLLARLKSSLSKALSHFYPFAGRMKDHTSVNCSDEGVLFVEARANCSMNGFLKRPDADLLYRLVPSQVISTDQPENTLIQLLIQVNIFTCGGISICVSSLHKIIDASSVGDFVRCWASIESGNYHEVIYPDLNEASTLYPPIEELPQDRFFFQQMWLMREGKSVLRRFVFDASAIKALKDLARSDLVPNPSRFHVIAGFIWTRIMNSSQKIRSSPSPSTVAVALNVRARTVPPMSKYSTGNMLWWAVAAYQPTDSPGMTTLQEVVSLLKESITKVDGAYLKGLQGNEALPLLSNYLEETDDFLRRGYPNNTLITSLNDLGLSNIDFGWGKPIWVSFIRGSLVRTFVNDVVIGETLWNNAMEVWVLLSDEEMAVLEKDPELLSFVSLNPGIVIPEARL